MDFKITKNLVNTKSSLKNQSSIPKNSQVTFKDLKGTKKLYVKREFIP